MDGWSAAALALALSIDGLAVGIAYGMRGITVPLRSLLIIGTCSAACFFVALSAGRFVAGMMDFSAPHLIGSSILIVLGSWHIAKGWLDRERASNGAKTQAGIDGPGDSSWATLVRIRIRALGVVVHVLREPGRADLDSSGAIETGEAFLLGLALGLDATAVGFGAAFIGVSFSFIGVVALAQLSLTWFGLRLGARFGRGWLGEKGYYVPGLILILLGLLQL